MVTRLMEYSYGRKSELSFGRVIVSELLENVDAIAAPMCLKNGNTVKVAADSRADVHGNFEMLLQLFINLVVNANKNTQNGTITIRASDRERDGLVLFRVRIPAAESRKRICPTSLNRASAPAAAADLG